MLTIGIAVGDRIWVCQLVLGQNNRLMLKHTSQRALNIAGCPVCPITRRRKLRHVFFGELGERCLPTSEPAWRSVRNLLESKVDGVPCSRDQSGSTYFFIKSMHPAAAHLCQSSPLLASLFGLRHFVNGFLAFVPKCPWSGS